MSKILVLKAFGRDKDGRLCSAFPKNPLSRTYELGRVAVAPDLLPFPIVDDFSGYGVPMIGTSYTDVAACLVDDKDIKTSIIPIAQTDKGDSRDVSFYQGLMRERNFKNARFIVKMLYCVKRFVPLCILASGTSCGDCAFDYVVSKLQAYSKEIDFPVWKEYKGH